MLVIGVAVAALRDPANINMVTTTVVHGTDEAVNLAFSLIGIMALWSGMMRLAEDAGLVRKLGKLLSPLTRNLFPDVPIGHPAIGAIVLALSANVLGLGNAATPLGIKAMQELQKLNPSHEEASDAICTFIAICAAGLTLIPGTLIALRSAAGSQDPTIVMIPTILATLCATTGAILADKYLRKRRPPITKPQSHEPPSTRQQGGYRRVS
jgi:spore maturation protein A